MSAQLSCYLAAPPSAMSAEQPLNVSVSVGSQLVGTTAAAGTLSTTALQAASCLLLETVQSSPP